MTDKLQNFVVYLHKPPPFHSSVGHNSTDSWICVSQAKTLCLDHRKTLLYFYFTLVYWLFPLTVPYNTILCIMYVLCSLCNTNVISVMTLFSSIAGLIQHVTEWLELNSKYTIKMTLESSSFVHLNIYFFQ